MKPRFAKLQDLNRIVEIYNQAIKSGNATADITEQSVEEKLLWFYEHSQDKFPIYVLEVDGNIIGWGSLSPYRNGREGLKSTAEITYYIDYSFHGKGYGSILIDYIIKDCKRLNILNLVALLLEINKASIKILKSFGFQEWGLLPNIANINGYICGHLIYGKNL